MKKEMKAESEKKSAKEWLGIIGVFVGFAASIIGTFLLIISNVQPQMVSCDDWKLVAGEYGLAFVMTLLSK
ncbi:MAG: hypothetical protein US83_C0004G0112 [Candidatus Falkowbacteria bacterium GW2011_GWC2_38_22]|uniref:Uncharacterized protein n=1 Tax=Candidatus Falkowbacteria bacterium GW2011_GWE1_38_31 TaxID=1618638 RepID=A0A0G0K4X9_9BACT|nr:MAG: hypothetical protein US73_C0002G0005 [Candidatus Falkowbacteria bacterium GW2011_GWF2_38_1205]KKQ61728.1 MAG: hypothetical protein US83_C0004G0112 [Candidatus Falkowbacteria bacterium GW2011_GWC2_38_22]KKQ63657.1 MAG: hypothetical protein US84_C0004G0005 [Candidatus Falkowbacteria bacterium GW2011_GWF1_38_22]KKQ65927.1 MAG: hypothetical protein US87_C0004G0112 [Candidatus Falkowbacteria bacterium GW2011_GWE2_38_254]KKQ70520.1 MAG: hypothetical protein US91_C0004G0005 [Candidatus Falkowb